MISFPINDYIMCTVHIQKVGGKRFFRPEKIGTHNFALLLVNYEPKNIFNRFEHEIEICLDVQVTSFLADPLLVLARTNA